MRVPANAAEITLEWLTAALHEAGTLDQARVTSIQSVPIGQLAFTGQIGRLQISYDKPEPGAPGSLVAKFSATHPEARAAVHSMGFYEREIGFYRELAVDCPVRTPRCYRRSRDGQRSIAIAARGPSRKISVSHAGDAESGQVWRHG
jgi:hypothetical protein